MTLEERLEKIEAMLVIMVERQQVREWYQHQARACSPVFFQGVDHDC